MWRWTRGDIDAPDAAPRRATVDAARAAAAEKAAAGLGLTLRAGDADEPSERVCPRVRVAAPPGKALPRAEDLVETALITAETYESRETALRSSIEESKRGSPPSSRAAGARGPAARWPRPASFAEWRAKETWRAASRPRRGVEARGVPAERPAGARRARGGGRGEPAGSRRGVAARRRLYSESTRSAKHSAHPQGNDFAARCSVRFATKRG